MNENALLNIMSIIGAVVVAERRRGRLLARPSGSSPSAAACSTARLIATDCRRRRGRRLARLPRRIAGRSPKLEDSTPTRTAIFCHGDALWVAWRVSIVMLDDSKNDCTARETRSRRPLWAYDWVCTGCDTADAAPDNGDPAWSEPSALPAGDRPTPTHSAIRA